MDIRELLQFMVKQNISDIHFKANCAPLIRLNGRLISTQQEVFTPDLVRQIAYTVMNPAQQKAFESEGELDLSYSLDGLSRFRVNVYRQKATIALSLRVIPWELKKFAELNLPAQTLERLCGVPSGLILVAGVTGAGKTTTVNAMVNHLNQNYAYNIITVEDPVEFYHKDLRSSISQREVGHDTKSFSAALKYILRQDPDVIVIGEMRDPETIAAAIVAAETGHLVLSTIHTIDTIHTVQRVVDGYPGGAEVRMQTRMALANVLRGVIGQRLIPTLDGRSRVPAVEVLIMTPYLRQLVTDGKFNEVYSAMSRGQSEGMITFEQDLLRLCRENRISQEAALAESLRPENLQSMLQGITLKL